MLSPVGYDAAPTPPPQPSPSAFNRPPGYTYGRQNSQPDMYGRQNSQPDMYGRQNSHPGNGHDPFFGSSQLAPKLHAAPGGTLPRQHLRQEPEFSPKSPASVGSGRSPLSPASSAGRCPFDSWATFRGNTYSQILIHRSSLSTCTEMPKGQLGTISFAYELKDCTFKFFHKALVPTPCTSFILDLPVFLHSIQV